MKTINFQKWKRAVMPEDFNDLQENIESVNKSILKNFIGKGLVSGGNIGLSGDSLIIDPFYGVNNSGQEIFSIFQTPVNVSAYINTGKYISVVAQYEEKQTGSEIDIDNVEHHYNEEDYYRIVLKESLFSFPEITDNEILLRDVRFSSDGSVDIIPGRSEELIKLEDAIKKSEAILRDDEVLRLAKEHANTVGAGSLSVTALNSISFENLVKNGDFSNNLKYWDVINNASASVRTTDNELIHGNYAYLTRTSAMQNEVLSQIICTNPPVGKRISLRGKVKMIPGQIAGCIIAIGCYSENGNLLLVQRSTPVITPELTEVSVYIDIPENCSYCKVLFCIEGNLNTAFFSEIGSNYGNVAQDYAHSLRQESFERNEEDNKRILKTENVQMIDDAGIENNHIVIFDKTNKKIKTSEVVISDDESLSIKSDKKVVTERAIESFVRNVVSGLVNSAPATLNTLNELATALNNDVNFATTMANELGKKLAKTENLNDLSNKATARTNLDVYSISESNTNRVPIGFVYTQYPNQSEPSIIFPNTTWENISNLYAGNFFRADGGPAAGFNAGSQAQSIIGHVHGVTDSGHNHTISTRSGANGVNPIGGSDLSGSAGVGGTNLSTTGIVIGNPVNNGSHGYVSYGLETRPVNQTIRIWKRTA